jgi:uncharacterized protein
MLHRKSRFDAAFSHPLFATSAAKLAPRMKLHSTVTAGLLAITAYDAGRIAVNGRPLTKSFLLTPRRLIEDWPPDSPDSLTEADLQAVAELDCPIVLLGTGTRQRFPAPALLRSLIDRRMGVEVMDTHAACRTYNILMAEGRDVTAALIIECAG